MEIDKTLRSGMTVHASTELLAPKNSQALLHGQLQVKVRRGRWRQAMVIRAIEQGHKHGFSKGLPRGGKRGIPLNGGWGPGVPGLLLSKHLTLLPAPTFNHLLMLLLAYAPFTWNQSLQVTLLPVQLWTGKFSCPTPPPSLCPVVHPAYVPHLEPVPACHPVAGPIVEALYPHHTPQCILLSSESVSRPLPHHQSSPGTSPCKSPCCRSSCGSTRGPPHPQCGRSHRRWRFRGRPAPAWS